MATTDNLYCYLSMILYSGNKYVFVGAGASGKDHAKKLAIGYGFKPDVSYTTRPARSGEVDGVDYHFISMDKFNEMISNDEFIQWNEFGNGHKYGTSKKSWAENDIFIIDPKTMNKLGRQFFYDRIIVFFNIPERIRRARLERRQDSNDSIDRRIQTDKKDFVGFKIWDVEISDSDFELGFIS